ncbi:type IV secretory system conjugative DNA transfer family protein [Streptomyces sp. MUM 16J]|uniref:type IV secretory system conjugative DNA transfer family protein n=1 Tax=Streptomyces sp. MUM 16J TaxID=2791988 RepID=UPI0005832687|nr:type IV secretory system conjugative DNA transfer family protein [Streptomyces sp. MUM 16J]MCH0560191.1 type VI secretion protein [Streptomyces sp. MUM 16J]
MRPDAREHRADRRAGQGGIPDGLLIGMLAFLLGMTLLVWTATGLAAWFAKGAWPDAVTFTHTPLAMRHLIGRPHDITGAWPATPAAQLSGWGLFWGLFIAQLMILFVLAMFVMGTVARWRAAKARRRTVEQGSARPAAVPGQRYEVPVPRTEPQPEPANPEGTVPDTAIPGPPKPGAAHPGPAASEPSASEPSASEPVNSVPTNPASAARLQEEAPPPLAARVPTGDGRPGGREGVLLAPRENRRSTAAQAIQDAPGPTLVVTSNPALWAETKGARAKLGPDLLYDPTHLCDTPARLHWSPTAGCEDKETALRRAIALLAPVQPTAKIDRAVADAATTLLRSYLHAAALENRTIRHVHRWSQGSQIQDAVRTLRTHPKAAAGAAGELEATLTAHPERRDVAQELISRALSALFTVNVREACTPNRTDALVLDSFVHEAGTLYVVGESIEDPRSNPGAMPLLTALVSHVVEHGRHMAARSSSGRLDPPLTLVLEDVAAVAPLPQLPDLLAIGADQGLPTLALLRSREQARSRWPHRELPV